MVGHRLLDGCLEKDPTMIRFQVFLINKNKGLFDLPNRDIVLKFYTDEIYVSNFTPKLNRSSFSSLTINSKSVESMQAVQTSNFN